MKSWTLLFIVSAAATIGVLGVNRREAKQTCITETRVTRQALKDDREGKSSGDRAVQCYFACMTKKTGWIAENGDFIPEKMVIPPLSEIPEHQRAEVEKTIQSCITTGKDGKDVCETIYTVYKCLVRNIEKKQ